MLRVARYTATDPARAAEIVSTYQDGLGTSDTNEIWAALFSDVEMQRPAAAVRDAQRAHAPTYTYQFGWPAADRRLGACHGIDIPFTFGNFVDGWAEFVGADGSARQLSRTLRDSWAAFARDGDPGWPPAPSAMRFDRECGVVDDPLRVRLASLGRRNRGASSSRSHSSIGHAGRASTRSTSGDTPASAPTETAS